MMYRLLQTFREENFCLDRELDSGMICLCIPVFDGVRQYGERYELTLEEYERSRLEPAWLVSLAEKCRRRENDDRLVDLPPLVRGEPYSINDWRFGEGLILNHHERNGDEVRTLQVFKREMFSLGCNLDSRIFFLRICTSIGPMDAMGSDEYEVTPEEYEAAARDREALIYLAAKCQTGNNDARLMGEMRVRRHSACHVGKWP